MSLIIEVGQRNQIWPAFIDATKIVEIDTY
jgi:hypothetical protein